MFSDIGLLGFTISSIWSIIILVFWLAIAFWPARVAARKGYSFLLFFLLSCILSFVVALIIAYLVPRKTGASTPPPAAPIE